MPKYRVYAQVMGTQQSMQTFDLPPGEKTVHHAYIPLLLPARLENYQPHMHVRGKAMSMEAIYPGRPGRDDQPCGRLRLQTGM